MARYEAFMAEYRFMSKEQFLDFSSSYFKGKENTLAALGRSRDHKPRKKQLAFGVAAGINGIPTALTIQKSNVQDKKRFRHMFRLVEKVLPLGSVLIFDCGANTMVNKRKIRERGFHYLTLKPKKRRTYKRLVNAWKNSWKETVFLNERQYECVKVH